MMQVPPRIYAITALPSQVVCNIRCGFTSLGRPAVVSKVSSKRKCCHSDRQLMGKLDRRYKTTILLRHMLCNISFVFEMLGTLAVVGRVDSNWVCCDSDRQQMEVLDSM